jgi:hypothetical protein
MLFFGSRKDGGELHKGYGFVKFASEEVAREVRAMGKVTMSVTRGRAFRQWQQSHAGQRYSFSIDVREAVRGDRADWAQSRGNDAARRMGEDDNAARSTSLHRVHATSRDGGEQHPSSEQPSSGKPSSSEERGKWSWTMVRVNDPRRDPASVKADVRPFCAQPDSHAAAHARIVVGPLYKLSSGDP